VNKPFPISEPPDLPIASQYQGPLLLLAIRISTLVHSEIRLFKAIFEEIKAMEYSVPSLDIVDQILVTSSTINERWLEITALGSHKLTNREGLLVTYLHNIATFHEDNPQLTESLIQHKDQYSTFYFERRRRYLGSVQRAACRCIDILNGDVTFWFATRLLTLEIAEYLRLEFHIVKGVVDTVERLAKERVDDSHHLHFHDLAAIVQHLFDQISAWHDTLDWERRISWLPPVLRAMEGFEESISKLARLPRLNAVSCGPEALLQSCTDNLDLARLKARECRDALNTFRGDEIIRTYREIRSSYRRWGSAEFDKDSYRNYLQLETIKNINHAVFLLTQDLPEYVCSHLEEKFQEVWETRIVLTLWPLAGGGLDNYKLKRFKREGIESLDLQKSLQLIDRHWDCFENTPRYPDDLAGEGWEYIPLNRKDIEDLMSHRNTIAHLRPKNRDVNSHMIMNLLFRIACAVNSNTARNIDKIRYAVYDARDIAMIIKYIEDIEPFADQAYIASYSGILKQFSIPDMRGKDNEDS